MTRLAPKRSSATLEERLRGFSYDPDEDVSGLSLLPSPEEPEAPARPEDAASLEYLSFDLEGGTYAVPLGAVLEILRARPLVEIPRARAPLLGVLDLRGTVTPVYDLGLGLGLRNDIRKVSGPLEECSPMPKEARILVARTPSGPAGVWVDCVRDVVRLQKAQLQAGAPDGGAVVGRAVVGAETLLLLELDKVLA